MKNFMLQSIKSFLLLSIVFLTISFTSTTKAQQSSVKNVVLVHGAFADGSGWRKVYDILNSKGYNVRIVQLPLTGLKDDVAFTKGVLNRLDGPVVLVGHSWAGNVITEAGMDSKVVALVYIAAFIPEVGETAGQLVSSVPAAPENGVGAPDKDGYLFYNKEKYHIGFAADITKAESDFMEASQKPILASSFGTPSTNAAWKTKPSYSIVTLQDKNIASEVQRKMYKRANSTITEIKASHVVYMSHPKEVANVIIAASKTK